MTSEPNVKPARIGSAAYWKGRADYWYKQSISMLAGLKNERTQAQTMAAALDRIAGLPEGRLTTEQSEHRSAFFRTVCAWCGGPWPRSVTEQDECPICIARATTAMVATQEAPNGQ